MHQNDRNSLATPLRALRRKLGVTQQALASLAGVSISTVCRIERAGRWPRCARTRKAILAALGLAEGATP